MFTVDDFDFLLDEGLIAQQPLAQRDQSRLMVLGRADGRVGHHVFSELPALLRRGDLLVFNDTQVIPAKFHCRRASGGKMEGLFLGQRAIGAWDVLLKNAGRCRLGERVELAGYDGASLELRENLGQGRWLVGVEPAVEALEVLGRAGQTPLPPYIRRPGAGDGPQDRSRYQTVYARRPGAVAAPTAGLHFTIQLLDALAQAGVETASVTLHVGMGTFLPVKVHNLAQHEMHSEWYELPQAAADKINAAKGEGRRVVAVGTTAVRVLETAGLETAGRPCGRGAGANLASVRTPHAALALHGKSGWTNIFIYPPFEFRVVDAMITNFHLPRSTLLMLVAAFCDGGQAAGTAGGGVRMILEAYRAAIAGRYRFFSYGDAMLIQ
jgi:S-adenosylmethionine:tRNA ribosyltransferase-isomerase